MEEFGIVRVNVKINARNVSVRWKGAQMVVSAPTSIPYDELIRILRKLAPKIDGCKPQTPYYIGQDFDFGELKVSIREQQHSPDRIFANFKPGEVGLIEVGSKWDFEKNDTITTISKFMCRMAQSVASSILLPRAKELSQRVGATPLMWTISNGHRVLGHCDNKGVIALSYALVFYPQHLRDYVIYHELAHLSEMNHSARFHLICDRYCDGREKQLVAELKSFKTPIIK